MAEQLHPEDIYQTLEYEIVTLKIKPGETISENQLCKRFGISRTPVRAALQRLEQNGFVQIIPCKGTIVTPINLDIVDQIVYQRTAVESTVLRDFIQVCSPKEYIEIKHKYDLLEEMADVVSEHDDALDQAFDELDAIDEDMDDLVDSIFGDDDEDEDEDEDDDGAFETSYEVTCPNCGTVNIVDEDTLMDSDKIVCAECGAAFDVEVLPDDAEMPADAEAESTDVTIE